MEQTLSILKPDITRRNLTGIVNNKFERAGLRIIAQKRIKLTSERASCLAGKFASQLALHPTRELEKPVRE